MGIVRSFEEILVADGVVAAINATFEIHQCLPPERVKGEYFEALGDPDLDPRAELYIKSNFSH